MDRLTYKTGSLFRAPQDAYLLHSCNCMGAWGAGVAKTFKNLYPDLYRQYNRHCIKNLSGKRSSILSQSLVAIDADTQRRMIALFTSHGYGGLVDPVATIVDATEKALIHLRQNPIFSSSAKVEIHSPRINAGLIHVPWEQTEAKINEFLKNNPNVNWTVWTLESEIKR